MFKFQIESEIKESLKAGDSVRLSTLRLLLSALRNEEIAKQHELSEEETLAVVQRQIKQRRESIEAYQKGGRTELASKEQAELEILSKYLPQQFSEDEVRQIAQEVLDSLPETDRQFGKVMGQAMGRVKGKADGNLVSKVVREILQ